MAEDFITKAQKASENVYALQSIKTLLAGGAIAETSDTPLKLDPKGDWRTTLNNMSPEYPPCVHFFGQTENAALNRYFKVFGKRGMREASRTDSNGVRCTVYELEDGATIEVSERFVPSKSGQNGAGATVAGHDEYRVTAWMDAGDEFIQDRNYVRRGDCPMYSWAPLEYFERGTPRRKQFEKGLVGIDTGV